MMASSISGARKAYEAALERLAKDGPHTHSHCAWNAARCAAEGARAGRRRSQLTAIAQNENGPAMGRPVSEVCCVRRRSVEAALRRLERLEVCVAAILPERLSFSSSKLTRWPSLRPARPARWTAEM